ncbi:cytochrome C [Mesobacillus boroniphilus]|uniref:Cytochrome C n=1 Tax=Mesobacillus boroniphilus TaxID=308892 RepID=A0A944CML7_9BACI|nr:cytochrome C [Mesobacillus boroniphilus]MBS8265481.1 cytochrome C [Mesobacillus boroniphilus]
MQKALISFIISALIGLGLGYIAFDVVGGSNDESTENASKEAETSKPQSDNKQEEKDDQPAAETVSADENILTSKGCLSCHSVSSLNLTGGATGPDLSKAFENVEGKHGKSIDQFLKEPTSAVMSGVIGGNPLSEQEISEVVKLLEEASKK